MTRVSAPAASARRASATRGPALWGPARAIARRELLSAFGVGAGWVVVALFLLPCGVVFTVGTFRNGEPASMRAVFEAAAWILLFVAPAISMRSVSDELRLGTFETLTTAPVSDGAIILGKFMAALITLAAMLAPTLVLAAGLEAHGRPDWGELACGYFGLLLAGAMYLAAGILASTLSASQLVAYLLAFFFWLTVALCCRLLPTIAPAEWADFLYAADPLRRLRDFTIGLLDTANVVYFVLLTGFFLAASTASLRARRSA